MVSAQIVPVTLGTGTQCSTLFMVDEAMRVYAGIDVFLSQFNPQTFLVLNIHSVGIEECIRTAFEILNAPIEHHEKS